MSYKEDSEHVDNVSLFTNCHCLLYIHNCYSKWGGCAILIPPPWEQAAHTYWLSDREDDSDVGPRQYSSPKNGVCKCHTLTFSYLLLGNEPLNGSHFSIFYLITSFAFKRIWRLNFNKKSENKNYSTVNACGLAFCQILKFSDYWVIQLYFSKIPIWTHQWQFGLFNCVGACGVQMRFQLY